jgi:nucleoside-diphosphate-sugar epimerase
MKVFITGASGCIGGSIAADLLEHGHAVRVLVRDAGKAEALARLGIEPVSGDLDDPALLAREAARADGVLSAASSDHRASLVAPIDALAGSGKALLHTSGSSVIADDACGMHASDQVFDEATPLVVPPAKAARHEIDCMVLAAAARGVRSAVLCNTMIYGEGRGLHAESAQIPTLLREALKRGAVHVVGRGLNRWSNVHIHDVTALYRLALEKAPAGSFYFVENGEASWLEIGQALAVRIGMGPVASWSLEEATAILGATPARYSFGSNSRVRAVRARSELGWAPTHTSAVQWIREEMTLPA